MPENTTPAVTPTSKKRKKVRGWDEHKGAKGEFFTSEDFAAYPQKDGRLKAFKIDENGKLLQEVGIFDDLESITAPEPAGIV